MYFKIYIPTYVWGLLLVGLLLLLAHAGLALFNRWYRRQNVEHNNEEAGIVFAVLTLIYSLLITFVFVAVWESYEELNRTIEKEADALNSVLIHSAALSDSLQVPVEAAIKSYCEKVVREEWDMAEGGRSYGSAIPALRLLLLQVRAENKAEENVLSLLDKTLGDITVLRRERLGHTRAHIPGLMWTILTIGTVLVILFSYFIKIDSGRLKRIFLSFLWFMIGMMLFLVYMLDNPFAGSTQVSKAPYTEIINRLTERDKS